jgi:hypothetical protein
MKTLHPRTGSTMPDRTKELTIHDASIGNPKASCESKQAKSNVNDKEVLKFVLEKHKNCFPVSNRQH